MVSRLLSIGLHRPPTTTTHLTHPLLTLLLTFARQLVGTCETRLPASRLEPNRNIGGMLIHRQRRFSCTRSEISKLRHASTIADISALPERRDTAPFGKETHRNVSTDDAHVA